MSFQSRDYQHFSRARVSLGIDVKNGQARITLAAANGPGGDKFSRPASRRIIDLRFDAGLEALKALSLRRSVFNFPYNGEKPRNDILRPLVRELGEHLKAREENHDWKGKIRDIISVMHAFSKTMRLSPARLH